MSLTFVLTPTRQMFLDWCYEHNEHPRSRNIIPIFLSTTFRGTKGRMRQEGDRVIFVGMGSGVFRRRHLFDAVAALMAMGYAECEDEWGNIFPITELM